MPLLFSPAEETTADEDQEQARQLVEMLQRALGDRWQDDWLAEGLPVVLRALLPSALSDGPQAATAEMAERVATELARLQAEDPERFAELEAAIGSLMQETAPLLPLIKQFIQAESWNASRRIVEQHPELLSDEADELLEVLIASAHVQNDNRAVQMFEEHRSLLRRCREAGIARAFVEKMLPPEALDQAEAAGLTPEQVIELQQATAQMPPEVMELFAELAASGVELHSPADLEALLASRPDLAARLAAAVQALLASRPDLAARLEAAAEAMGMGGMDVPPQFRADLQQAQEAEQHYRRTGDRSALDAAAAAWERILGHSTFPSSDERFQLAAMNNAGGVFLRRYWATGGLADLNRALELGQTAVQRTPPDSPDLPSILNNLAAGLRARYARTGALQDLHDAVGHWQRAVTLTAEGSPDLPSILNNLAAGLRARYARTGALQDLHDAVGHWQRAVTLTAEGSPDLPMYLNNLAAGLSDRYARTGA
ncbi:MAG TPA: tetratricopeptide repeat protein, partial [Anaerolineae bacterium]|nr:tetratricopeptide repeat protein [Anaerolineae bacterium]